MRIVPLNFCIAKIQPQYWDAIAIGTKTVEIRDELVDADYFIFIDNKYRVLGKAQILSEESLFVDTTSLPDNSCTTMSDLEHMYPDAVKNGKLVEPLYAYRIRPNIRHDITFDVLGKIM